MYYLWNKENNGTNLQLLWGLNKLIYLIHLEKYLLIVILC